MDRWGSCRHAVLVKSRVLCSLWEILAYHINASCHFTAHFFSVFCYSAPFWIRLNTTARTSFLPLHQGSDPIRSDPIHLSRTNTAPSYALLLTFAANFTHSLLILTPHSLSSLSLLILTSHSLFSLSLFTLTSCLLSDWQRPWTSSSPLLSTALLSPTGRPLLLHLPSHRHSRCADQVCSAIKWTRMQFYRV